MQDSDKRMEKYCFGGETEAVVTSYHTSLPGVREARLETAETPLPLTASSLQAVLQTHREGPVLQPYILNKTNSESAVEILTRSYPYRLNPKTGAEERRRTIPYKINDVNIKNEETKENSFNQNESSAKKTKKSEVVGTAIPYRMKGELKFGKEEVKERKEDMKVERKEESKEKAKKGEKKRKETEKNKKEDKIKNDKKGVGIGKAKEFDPEEAGHDTAGGPRVEREAAQQVPKEINRKEQPVEICGTGGHPVRIRQKEQPAKIYVGLTSSRQTEKFKKNNK